MSISFVKDVKNSLCTTYPKKQCCKLALLYGYMYASPEFTFDKIRMRFQTDKVREYISELFFEIFSIVLEENDDIIIDDSYTLSVLFDIFDTDSPEEISSIVYSCPECTRAYLKGIFISCGSMTEPGKSYHMEFYSLGDGRIKELASFFDLQGLPMHLGKRKDRLTLYCKSVEIMERYLSFIGASKAVFGILNARMLGETRNQINRKSNFDNANLSRTVSASSEQIKALEKLEKTGRLALLPPELKYTADLRIQYSDISLSALAAMHEPPITKSGLTHRLQKIIDIAKEEK